MKNKKISIQKIYDKGSRRLNEDAFLIKENFFGVFDGAGSLVDFIDNKGRTGGRIASSITKRTFSKNDRPLRDLAVEANEEIKRAMERVEIDVSKKENLWVTKAAVVRIRNKKAECFQIGDSLIMMIKKDGSPKLLFGYKDHELKTLIKWKELADQKVKKIWDVVENRLVETRRRANIDYGCLNGEKEAVEFFNLKTITLENLKSIILLTDGLFPLKEDPEDPDDWKTFAERYQTIGLKGMLNRIRSLENKDPYCWRYPRLKKHDDIAAIGIDFD